MFNYEGSAINFAGLFLWRNGLILVARRVNAFHRDEVGGGQIGLNDADRLAAAG